MNNLPKKKKPAINAFSCFAADFAKENNISSSMAEIVELAKPHWEKMTEAEKAEYKEKAQQQKSGFKGTGKKFERLSR